MSSEPRSALVSFPCLGSAPPLDPGPAAPEASAGGGLCARCAARGPTCCTGSEIYLSPGDRARIAAHIGRDDFWRRLAAGDPCYLEDDDPVWQACVFAPDGTRPVLRWQANGDCVFLGPQGCGLPETVRPRVCLLHPYSYTSQGLLEPAAELRCPRSLLAPGQALVEAVGIDADAARRWHAQLYEEMQGEPHLDGRPGPRRPSLHRAA